MSGAGTHRPRGSQDHHLGSLRPSPDRCGRRAPASATPTGGHTRGRVWPLPHLTLSALQVAVAMAVSSGAPGLEAAALVGDDDPSAGRPGGARRPARFRGSRLACRQLGSCAVRGHAEVECERSRREVDSARHRLPVRVRLLRRPAQRRQVHADQRLGRQQGCDRLLQAADHPTCGSRDRARARCPARADRHAGLHKPRTLLGERLNDLVRATWSEVDVVGVCLPANERIGPGDGYLVGEVAALRRRPELMAIATKSDLVTPTRMAEHLSAIPGLEEQLGMGWADIVPVSAVIGGGTTPWTPRVAPTTDGPPPNSTTDRLLTDLLVSLLPAGPALYRTARSPTSRPRPWSPS